jgi:tRNA A-37 threonylcarbamoyl transferase component Bud32
VQVLAAADRPGAATLIRRGGRFKADIKHVRAGGSVAILKDFSGKPWAARLLGRLQIARELRALDRLRGLPGIPACGGRAGRYGLLIERVEGERITRWCERNPERRAALFARLDRLVAAIHARGVVHVDLRKRDNILVTPTGRPYLIDFNASFRFDRGRAAGRALLAIARRVDTQAILKWKARLAPALLRPAEARSARRMNALRRLWIFN